MIELTNDQREALHKNCREPEAKNQCAWMIRKNAFEYAHCSKPVNSDQLQLCKQHFDRLMALR